MNYGTLTNHVYSEEKPIEPKVGDGATLLRWSDRHACTIIDVKKNHVIVTRDITERVDQNFERGPQKYNYRTDLEAQPIRAKLRKNGKYYINDQVLNVGYRDEYYDYFF